MKKATKIKKGILPVLICLLLVLTMINGSIKANADSSVPIPSGPGLNLIDPATINSEDVFVTADDSANKTCIITGYIGSEDIETLYIPEKIRGNTVVAVSDHVFQPCWCLRQLIVCGDVEFQGTGSSMFYNSPVTSYILKPTIFYGKKGTKTEIFATNNDIVFQAMDGPQEFTVKINTDLYDRAPVKWSPVDGALSYVLYRKKGNGKYECKGVLSDNFSGNSGETFPSTGLELGATYTFKMYPVFRLSSNQGFIGLASKEVSITMKLTELKKVRAKGIKSGIQLNWERDKDVSGYEIFMKSQAKGAKADYKRIKVIGKNKTTSYCCKKLVKGKKYSFKVRSFKTLTRGDNKGKKVYSSFVTVHAKAK